MTHHPDTATAEASAALVPARSDREVSVDGDRLALVTEALAAYHYSWDVRTGHVERALDFPALLGVAPDEVASDAGWWQARIHPEDLAGHVNAVRLAFDDPAVRRRTMEYRVRHRDGSWRWVCDPSVYVRDAAGRVVQVVGATIDITDEYGARMAERAAREAAERTTAWMRAMLSFGTQINDAATQDAVLDVIMGGVRTVLETDIATLLLNDEGTDGLRVSACAGLETNLGAPVRVPVDGGVAGDIALSRQQRIVDDVTADHGVSSYLGEGARSLVGVPLIGHGRVMGVLIAASRTPRAFTREDVSLLELIAARAAAALVRARLYEAERVARERAECLQALSAGLTRVLTRAEVADVVVRHLVAALGADAGGVVELSDDGREFVLLATIGYDAAIHERYARFPVDIPLPAGDVARDRSPVFLGSRNEWIARYEHEPILSTGASDGAWVVLPLLVEDRLLGALTVKLPGPRAFPESERRFMQAFADLCAQAHERARLHDAEHAARSRAEALQHLTAALARAATPEEVATAATHRGMEATGTVHGVLSLLDDEGTAFTIVAAPGVPEDMMATWHRYPNAGDIPAAVAVRTGAPVYSRTRAEYVARGPGLDEIAERCGIGAEAVLPLRANGQTLGTLSFAFATPREFDAADELFLKSVSDLVAAALDRARLFAAERSARADAEAARGGAEAANRAKMDFLATMSHELRTPLNAIGGYVDLLSMGVRGPVTALQQRDLARIQRSQQHLLGLINEVLNFARLESGAVLYDIAEHDVATLLGGLEALVMPPILAKGLTLTIEPCDAALRVRADDEKLRQILLNLVSNAVKFTAPGGEVRITAQRGVAARAPDATYGSVAITVRDSGVGIPAGQLEAIFEPFVQVGRALNNPVEGTGLGLAISRDLARGMGGELTVVSEPGAGSSFTLVLPRSA